jgi:hypothetical protein
MNTDKLKHAAIALRESPLWRRAPIVSRSETG